MVKLLIVKLSSQGDLFHALPVVHNLKTELGAEIDWVVQTEYVGLVGCFTDVRRAIPFDRHRFFRSLPALLKTVRQERYDVAVDLQGLLKSAVVTRLATAERKVGPSFQREGARFLYDEVAGVRNKSRHAVEEMHDVIDHLGLKRRPAEFPIQFPSREMESDSPRVAMFPLSRWASKNWPLERFAELARRLTEADDITLYLLGSKSDQEACRRIERAANGSVVNLAGKTDLVQTGSVLSRMDVVVGNDTGPVHMAAALGIPCVTLYGPTLPERTGPYGEMHTVLQHRKPCAPCRERNCRRGDHLCMTRLTVDEVEAAVRAALAGV